MDLITQSKTKRKKKGQKKKMKKFSFAKIASLVFVCAMLLCALAVTALAADEPTVEIVSNNAFYGEKYQLLFAVNAPDGAEVSATDSEGNELGVAVYADDPTPVINGVQCTAYIIKEGVAAQAIDEVITFTVEYNGTTAVKEYSILQYVYERMYVSDNRAEGNELAMFEALLAYAEAADVCINGTAADQTISNYKYVSVVGGTLDGNNTAGMFLPGEAPFANIVATIDVGAGQSIGWTISVDGAEAEEISLADLKALTVTGDTVVTATAVDSVCEHVYDDATCTEDAVCTLCGAVIEEAYGHDWADANCTTPKTCNNCRETEGAALGHSWKDATCTEAKTCTVCTAIEGEPLGHSWKDATCEAPKTCTICKVTEGEKAAHNVVGGTCTVCNTKLTTTGKADFNTLSTNSSYASRKTTAGWTGTNCAVVKVNSTYMSLVMNGKTSAKGSIASPTLSGGVSSVTFSYTNTFSESKGVDITISIKQNGTVVASYQLDDNSVTQNTVETYTWVLDEQITGEFTIEFANNSPSNSTSNKDRVSIFEVQWESAYIPE